MEVISELIASTNAAEAVKYLPTYVKQKQWELRQGFSAKSCKRISKAYHVLLSSKDEKCNKCSKWETAIKECYYTSLPVQE